MIPEADATGAGGSVYVNWIATRRVTVFADQQFVRTDARAFVRHDNLARLGINLIHPKGLLFRVTGSHFTQRFIDTALTDLPRSTFGLVDVDASYQFGAKKGLISLRVTNALDRAFSSVIEGITIDPFLPERRIVLSFRWRFV